MLISSQFAYRADETPDESESIHCDGWLVNYL